LGLPKGRMQEGVFRLLADAGLPVRPDERGYRPLVGSCSREPAPLAGLDEDHLPLGFGFEAKILKPQNIVEMLAIGSRDLGFAGADWVRELSVDVVELLDTGLDAVRILAAASKDLVVEGRIPLSGAGGRDLVLASEYEGIAREWIARRAPSARFVRSYGATEVFPPEDADIVIDNSATGSTLRANGLEVVDLIMSSSTRLYASRRAMADPGKRSAAESLVLLLRSVLEARHRVMLEINVPLERLEALTAFLPCLRAPTVSPLKGGEAFAVRVAAKRESLPGLIPEIKRLGGTDIVVTELAQLVP
jgi:ATP phosphoribosyltransferase